MKENTTKMPGIRVTEATCKTAVQAAKTRDYANPSAFIGAATRLRLRTSEPAVSLHAKILKDLTMALPLPLRP